MSEDTKDCTRLPVVAAAKALCNHHAELCGVNADDQWTHYSEDFLADVQIVMPHLHADAQALLAEKDARIAQMIQHKTDYMEAAEATKSALKAEVVRLKTMSDNYCSLLMDANQKLQAAPAERGERLPMYTCTGKGGEYVKLGYAKPAGAIKTIQGDSGLIVYRDTSTGQLYFRDPTDFNQRMSQLADLVPCSLGGDMIVDRTCADDFARLNPSPATADSDVREVK